MRDPDVRTSDAARSSKGSPRRGEAGVHRRRSGAGRLDQAERGMVTAEMAIGLTGLVIIVLGLLWAVAVVTAQVRCIDAARDAARARARGESAAVSRAQAQHSAPDGADIRFQRQGGDVRVEVVARASPPWPVLSGVGAVSVRGRATVALEPGVGQPTVPVRDTAPESPEVVRGARTGGTAP